MIISGKAKWAKVIGGPFPGYKGQYNEWTVDVIVDKDTQTKLLKAGLTPERLKDKDGEVTLRFRRKEFSMKGNENKPIEIIDHHGEYWGKDLIGNGSTVNVSFSIYEGNAIIDKMQVWDHVPYGNNDSFPTKETNTPKEVWSEEEVA